MSTMIHFWTRNQWWGHENDSSLNNSSSDSSDDFPDDSSDKRNTTAETTTDEDANESWVSVGADILDLSLAGSGIEQGQGTEDLDQAVTDLADNGPHVGDIDVMDDQMAEANFFMAEERDLDLPNYKDMV